ncbi:hypothetical protein [Oceanobacillus sp. CFH 90083]|uniref:hypothetical protein n=1 Tax=Oceanobacillus sp. CFH 90083 TaxID=2592336 RepID=UPI00128DE33C|nr:hypothetical protein [Oceanobacillus sp. CFH 90083]
MEGYSHFAGGSIDRPEDLGENTALGYYRPITKQLIYKVSEERKRLTLFIILMKRGANDFKKCYTGSSRQFKLFSSMKALLKQIVCHFRTT